MRRALPLLVALFAVAGCINESDTQAVPSTSAPIASTTASGFHAVENQSEAPRTLDLAPAWRQGEWWKIHVHDFAGHDTDIVRVVAGAENDNYLVGMPMDTFSDDLMVLHLPGFGQVKKSDLSFGVHDVPYEPLKFPLKDGATWDTHFEGRPIHARVYKLSPTQVRVQLDGASDHMNATYDAPTGEVLHHVAPAYANYDVLAHGYNYTGMVVVPHMHKLVFQHGRIAGALGLNLQPSPVPSDTVKVDTTYDRASFVLIAGSIVSGQSSTGYYDEKATAPGGKTFEMTLSPAEGKSVKFQTFFLDKPGGDWKFDHVVLGAGFAGAEGIAYHEYIVDMPSGRVLPSTGTHQHGG